MAITQKNKVLNHLKKYNGLTSFEAFHMYKITRFIICEKTVMTYILKKYFNRTRWTNHSDFPDKTMLGKTKYSVKNDQGQKIK